MLHPRGNEGKPADGDWHDFRARARRTAYSEAEFSDIDRVRYDLDADDPHSANITGRDNPETYDGEGGHQVASPDGVPDHGRGLDDAVHGPNPHRQRDRLVDLVEGR